MYNGRREDLRQCHGEKKRLFQSHFCSNRRKCAGLWGQKIIIRDKTHVGGNVQIEAAGSFEEGDTIKICKSVIDGDVQLFKNVNVFIEIGCSTGQNYIEREYNHIKGNLQLEENYWDKSKFENKGVVIIRYNKIEGDLQFYKNDAGYGDFRICKNWIYGNLQCYENFPKPISCENMVYGDIEGQCYYFDNCECDLNDDGYCDGKDLRIFANDYGRDDCSDFEAKRCKCDLEGDGDCDGLDLYLFIQAWNSDDCTMPDF